MARIPMVTRTIKTTTANVLCADLIHGELCNKDVTLPRTWQSDADIMKYLAKNFDNDSVKAVQVIETTVSEKLYGMTEADFVKYASPIEKDAEGAPDEVNA